MIQYAINSEMDFALKVVDVWELLANGMQIFGLTLAFFSFLNKEKKDYQFFVPLCWFIFVLIGKIWQAKIFDAL